MAAALSFVATACLPSPQRTQSAALLDQLTRARTLLLGGTYSEEACNAIGDVETRLYGEPGLVDVQPAWTQLADAAHALQAVCGQGSLLAQPGLETTAVEQAHVRWQAGIQRELGLACDHLRAAASSLQRDAPC